MPDYLVSVSHRRHTETPSLLYVIGAPSRDDVRAAYPCFAQAPVLELPSERPEWLGDFTLDALERNVRHVLGEDEPAWLREIVAHHANGDDYRWYALSERLDDGTTRSLGTLGTWRVPEAGETFSIPKTSRPFELVDLRLGDAPRFDVLRVTVDRIGPPSSEDYDGELLVRVLDD